VVGRDRRAVVLVAGAAILLTALSLRPAVTSFGALLREVQQATGMSSTVAGVLTTLPPICFGVFGLVGGWVGRRLGTAQALLAVAVLTTVGLAARVATDAPLLIVVFTVPALVGMALGNVLLPVAVKRWFPRHIGRATGAYSMVMAVGAALAAAVSVPIAETAGGWRAGLGVWAVVALVAVPCWLWLRSSTRAGEDGRIPEEAVVLGVAEARLGSRAVAARRHPKAWALAGFFGLQGIGAYVLVGWLPTIYRDAGVHPRTAGLLLGLVMILAAPISVLLPELAARRDDQRVLVLGLAAMSMAGYIGLLVAPAAAPWVWATLLGVGFGAFPLALVLVGLRASTAEGTAQLSALSQGVGYLITAGGPFAIGALHDATGGWTWPLLVLVALLVPQLACGLVAAKPGFVDEQETRAPRRHGKG
jgi:MFS transporter, CP family, cyanate transporter